MKSVNLFSRHFVRQNKNNIEVIQTYRLSSDLNTLAAVIKCSTGTDEFSFTNFVNTGDASKVLESIAKCFDPKECLQGAITELLSNRELETSPDYGTCFYSGYFDYDVSDAEEILNREDNKPETLKTFTDGDDKVLLLEVNENKFLIGHLVDDELMNCIECNDRIDAELKYLARVCDLESSFLECVSDIDANKKAFYELLAKHDKEISDQGYAINSDDFDDYQKHLEDLQAKYFNQ